MSRITKILQPSGVLDGVGANQLRKEVSDIISGGADTVLLDLKDVTFVDSSGLGALVATLKMVRAAGSKLVICSINDQVKMLFELTSMDRVFEIYRNQDEFQKATVSPEG
jgi:anti-anti-sigma factor